MSILFDLVSACAISANEESCSSALNGFSIAGFNVVDVSVDISNNSTLNVKDDTIGAIYPVIESGNNFVVEFKYEEKALEGIADGDYSETLHFEIPTNTTELNLTDDELSNVKLLYGKHCFCKGEAGYYKVKKGKMKVVKTTSDLYFDISFNIDETSTKLVRVSKHIAL